MITTMTMMAVMAMMAMMMMASSASLFTSSITLEHMPFLSVPWNQSPRGQSLAVLLDVLFGSHSAEYYFSRSTLANLARLCCQLREGLPPR
jgi:hypothetical protein